ncbi:MAG: hypothetical protein AAFZ07_27975 [Actinomycetota bacterium]
MTAVTAPVRRPVAEQADPTPVGVVAAVRERAGVATALTITALLLSLLGLAVFHAQITQQSYELDRLEEQIVERQLDLDTARLELAALESPTRLQNQASSLGLDRPAVVEYLQPSDDIVDHVLSTAPEGNSGAP